MTEATVGVRAPEGVRRWGIRTAVLIAAVTLVRLLFVSTTDIANGEAYYYLWSRFPSLSYYDHPPLVAWMTWLTTRASHGSLAIRSGPLVCAALFGALLYTLGRRLFSARAGFIAVAVVTLIPVFFASSYALNPEAPLAPLWVLGLLMLERMREHDEPWRPLAAGAVAGLAFLAKYSGVLLLGVGLLYLLLSPQGRRWLRRPSLYLGSLVALAVATPVLVWNQQRGWPSVALHLVERRAPADAATLALNAWQALVGQLAPFHPLMFPGLLVVLAICIRRSAADDRYRFLALASWPVLLFFLVMMMRVRDPESHWTMVGYIPLAVAAGGLLDERAGRPSPALRWYIRACLAITVVGTAVFYAYSRAPALRRFLPAGAYDPDRDFFNEMVGWSELREAVGKQASALGPTTVVASCQYALCAHILTALDDRPAVYCPGLRRTEFDFLGRRDPPASVPVLYIQDDHYHEPPATLLPDRDCRPLPTLSIERGGVVMQNYHLWACSPGGRG
ncbi:MAG TPA: glycosyltransferase family 39 protein [Myxococcaceae bacterium]|nr:glycosyltransferase family 39 protein [Myxococcaceae bacterium]